ncbi:glycosyltransferase family 2 protein [Shimia litoralis]|jgi:glycosyltransferase involved in cell wall biosynthesis|uniref:Glycosyltransferase family 2 protein n=1 Tax=Shimia litoralis TaxID=420403 RepID=A0A4U7MU91_9RHOB|nr:glycosyltransferase family 2 protein [Shimia litoralis]TKZ15784.1 glycosyltransferase family 2 protein [Shimia litoralis]
MKISIVIPTRERSRYLRHSVQTALEIDDDNIEIIVSDNASSDGTKELMQEVDDRRLVYVNTGARLSMRQNFERAFEASTGDYLIFFGDDDGILPKQFPYLRELLEANRPDGLSWIKATYGWPIDGYGKKTGGVRFYRSNCFGSPKPFRGADNLRKLMTAEVSNLRPVPDIYHGCLSRAYMLKTSMDGSTVFDSAIPDVNLTYRSILKDGSFVGVNHPFSINGYSPASTGGGHGAEQNNLSDTNSSKIFAKENLTDTMSDVCPHAGSVALAFFSTLETLRRNHALEKFEPDYLRWYRYVLGSTRKNPALAESLRGILWDHATATCTESALTAALEGPLQAKRSPKERLARAHGQLHSFRVSASEGTENTILTAAHTMDAILGQDFGAVLSGDMTSRLAWKAAKRRSMGFQRQL